MFTRFPALPARMEQLEKRSLMSGDAPAIDAVETVTVPPVSAAADPDTTGPLLIKEQLIGAEPRRVEGIVLTFNEPLDEASAEDLDHFRVGRRTDRRQNNDFDDNVDDRNRRGLIRFESATYDPATFSVTLIARDPFNIVRRFRNIRVLGRPEVGVRNVAGNSLDGNEDGVPGKDAIERFTFTRAKGVRYGETDGDNVAISINGPGRLWVIRKTPDGEVLARGDAVRVYIDDAVPGRSVVTGRITGNAGDGFNNLATIGDLVNVSTADVQLLTNPQFQIQNAIP